MISVQQSLGRLVVVTATDPVSSMDALRMQQDLSAMLRRMGERALLICDFRDLTGMDPDVARVVGLMLGSSGSLARRRVVLGARAGSFAQEFVDTHDGWAAVADVGELQAVLRGIGSPAELHAAHGCLVRQQAA